MFYFENTAIWTSEFSQCVTRIGMLSQWKKSPHLISKIHPKGSGLLDGFSIGRYEEKRESFDLFAMNFDSGVMRFSGGKSLLRWSLFKITSPSLSFLYKERYTANSKSFKIAKKKTLLRQKNHNIYMTGKVIQRLFNIDLYTYLAIYRCRWSKR